MRAGWLALAALTAAAGLPMSLSAAPAPQAAASTDWVRTVALTPTGGFRMGNPAAPVKLVEYGSLTCSHCGHFAAEATPALHSLVRSGKLSFEYRNFVLNGADIAATLIARCGGVKDFFAIADAMYASQRQWVGAIAGLSSEQKAELFALAPEDRIPRLAAAAGLIDLAAKHGVTPKQARQCLANDAGLDQLQIMHDAAQKLGVAGTPSFFINGAKVNAADWAGLEPALRKALGTGG